MVYFFGLTILLTFTMFFWIIARHTADEAVKLIKEGLVPFLQASAPFITAIFGSILAFVLGYYFGQRDQPNSPKKSK